MKARVFFFFMFLTLFFNSIFAQETNKGFYKTINASYLLGAGDNLVKEGDLPTGILPAINIKNNSKGYGVRAEVGYYLSRHTSLGLGVGIQGHNFPSTLPLSINMKGLLLNQENTPFLNASIGTFLKVKSSWEKGNFYQLGIGYRHKISKSLKSFVSVNYNRSKIIDGSYYWKSGDASKPQFEHIDLFYNNIEFNIGIEL